jgi:hypothetical protein
MQLLVRSCGIRGSKFTIITLMVTAHESGLEQVAQCPIPSPAPHWLTVALQGHGKLLAFLFN